MFNASTLNELNTAFAAIAEQRPDALLVGTDPFFLLRREEVESKNLSRAALETLSIIAYHQPATRAEVEEVRGVATGKELNRFDDLKA